MSVSQRVPGLLARCAAALWAGEGVNSVNLFGCTSVSQAWLVGLVAPTWASSTYSTTSRLAWQRAWHADNGYTASNTLHTTASHLHQHEDDADASAEKCVGGGQTDVMLCRNAGACA